MLIYTSLFELLMIDALKENENTVDAIDLYFL